MAAKSAVVLNGLFQLTMLRMQPDTEQPAYVAGSSSCPAAIAPPESLDRTDALTPADSTAVRTSSVSFPTLLAMEYERTPLACSLLAVQLLVLLLFCLRRH